MIERTPAQFSTAAPLFQSAGYGVLTAATLEGVHPGRVFVDDPAAPRSGLLCTRVGYYFLAGEPHTDVLAWLQTAFPQQLAPQQVQAIGDPQILLFYPSDPWQALLLDCFKEQGAFIIHKKRMTLPAGRAVLPQWSEMIPDGLRMEEYQAASGEQLQDLQGEASLFYGSLDAMLSCSPGFRLVDDQGTVASACHAVFVGAGEAEISIFTAREYRRRGLAKLTAAAFIAACRARGLAPIWGCFPENQPSVALAYALGFEDDVDQPICFWETK